MREFRLLGGVLIEDGGQPAEVISSDKSVALLAYLIYTRERQTREHIADLLWETDSTQRSLKNLRNLLSKVLRRAASELLIEPKHLTFVAGDGIYVDLNDLEEALSDGDVEQLDRALQLYHGDFLGNFYLRDAPHFNEWLVLAQERLLYSGMADQPGCKNQTGSGRLSMFTPIVYVIRVLLVRELPMRKP